jgi:hypothetical protein
MRLRTVLLAVAAIGAAISAPPADRPLTNSEIASMLASGLPEGTILLKIETAAYRGLVNLDASSAALIALKQKGASEQVLNAVMWAEPFGAPLKQQLEEDRAAPGLPNTSGVYYRSPSGWVPLPSVPIWPPFYSFSSFAFLRSREYEVPLGGSHANLQIDVQHVGFYLRSPSSLNWRIVRLTSRGDERLLRIVSTGHPATREIFEADRTRPVQISRVASDIFTLVPVDKTPLKPGEYALCTTVPGVSNVYACHEFGIPH